MHITTASESSGPTEFDGLSEGSMMGEHAVRVQEEAEEPGEEQGEYRCLAVFITTAYRLNIVGRVTVTIDILSDDVLLQVFRFYQFGRPEISPHPSRHTWKWLTLVHVCQRWRAIVSASPRSLDLRLLCTAKTRVKEMLDVWPIVPIQIDGDGAQATLLECGGADNIIAALEHHDRVCYINLNRFRTSLSDRVTAAMQKPFPALTDLHIQSWDMQRVPMIPEAFLGGSVPRLRLCIIGGVRFPGIWKLLSTANHLVILHLKAIPHSTYISPEGMATLLSGMPNLEQLYLRLLKNLCRASRHPPPSTWKHVVLPALTRFLFFGDSEYIEDLCSRIDTPLLGDFLISFYDRRDDGPQILDFLNRTKLRKAHDQGPMKRWMHYTVGN